MSKRSDFKKINNNLSKLEWNNLKQQINPKRHLKTMYSFLLIRLFYNDSYGTFPPFNPWEENALKQLEKLKLVKRTIDMETLSDTYVLTTLGRNYVTQSFKHSYIQFTFQRFWTILIDILDFILMIATTGGGILLVTILLDLVNHNSWSNMIGIFADACLIISATLCWGICVLIGCIALFSNHKNPLLNLSLNNTESKFIDFIIQNNMFKSYQNNQQMVQLVKYNLFS